MRIRRFDLFILTISLFGSVACTPQFNRKVAAVVAPGPSVIPRSNNGTVVDPQVAGGGALGTSAGFRVSGVNIGFVEKSARSLPSYNLRPGVTGQAK